MKSPITDATILAQIKEHGSRTKAAEALNCRPKYIDYRIQKMGLACEKRGRQKTVDYDEVIAFYKGGHTLRSTAERFGVSFQRIHQIVSASV